MATKNYYPQLPEIPYKRTTINMQVVIDYANSLSSYSTEIKRMAYCMFRNESGNGMKGVNGNFAGIQADCGLWSGLVGEIGTSVRIDSGGALRRFICFDEDKGYQRTFDFLCYKVNQRGMYIGAPEINNVTALTTIYLRKWVGRTNATPNIAEIANWTNLYNDAKQVIN